MEIGNQIWFNHLLQNINRKLVLRSKNKNKNKDTYVQDIYV